MARAASSSFAFQGVASRTASAGEQIRGPSSDTVPTGRGHQPVPPLRPAKEASDGSTTIRPRRSWADGILGRMVPDPVMDRLEASFERQRSSMLKTQQGKWALMVVGRMRNPQFFDTEGEAVSAGFRTGDGRRFLVKEVLMEDREIYIPLVGLTNRP